MILRRLPTLLLLAGLGAALGGCVAYPYGGYGYGYPYGGYGYPATASVGIGWGGGWWGHGGDDDDRGDWHGHGDWHH
ncbi:MAG: hypothetical protein KGL52_10590 [Rhodospirillales bacterium]|nr:hypothetical protein [Rhodospirillales bacterium]